MKISKDAKRIAKRIFILCSSQGQLNEDKIREATTQIINKKPRDYRAILVALHRLVRLHCEAREAHIESAQDLDEAQRTRIESDLARQYGEGLSFSYSINPDLLGGVKMRIGDDVLDGSVQSRIERLAQSF